MLKWLRCLKRGHQLEFVRNVYGDEILLLGARSIWRCTHCERRIHRHELHQADPGDVLQPGHMLTDNQARRALERLKAYPPLLPGAMEARDALDSRFRTHAGRRVMRWIPVSERMPGAAQDNGDVLYCRVVYDDPKRATDRRVGYFDGGEWKDISGYKFATYGGTVTHWYEPPELGEAETVGMLVERWYCYSMPDAPLNATQRAEVIEFARGFEECTDTREELEAMDDSGIVSAAYSAMADYARGQM